MSGREIELVERIAAYSGYFRVDRYRLRHALFAGGMSGEIEREVFDRGQVAAILPVDPVRDEVILIEQFRPGAYAVGWNPWLVECVAGVIEAGETPEGVARRESVEEAGCDIQTIEHIGCFLTSPGASSETVSLYCGRVSSEGIGELHGLESEGEDIRVRVVSVDGAIELLDRGEIVNAKTAIALHWLARHYPALKACWLRGAV